MPIRLFELRIDIPFLKKGQRFYMHDRQGYVYALDENKNQNEYPLRNGLANYLWLLCTERKYMKFISSDYDD